MMRYNEVIEVSHRDKTKDYQATYNGVVACGQSPTEAIENARKKWELMIECEMSS